MNLKSMSADKLSKLRAHVDAALTAKVIEERRAVQDQLTKLERLAAGGSRGKGVRGGPRVQSPRNVAIRTIQQKPGLVGASGRAG
jgi:hypothetical protein